MYDTAIYCPLEKDFNFALMIKMGIETLNKNVFLDYNQYKPDDDPEIFLDRLEGISSLVFIISAESWKIFANDNCFEYKLLTSLLEENIKIIPLVIDNSRLPPSSSLSKEVGNIFRFNTIFYSHENFMILIKRIMQIIINRSLDGSKKTAFDISLLSSNSIHKVNRLVTLVVKFNSISKTIRYVLIGIFFVFYTVYSNLTPNSESESLTYLVFAFALYYGLMVPLNFLLKKKFKGKIKFEQLTPEETIALADQINNNIDTKKEDNRFIKEIKVIIFSSI